LYPGFDIIDSNIPYAGVSAEELTFLLKGGLTWVIIYVPFYVQKRLLEELNRSSNSIWYRERLFKKSAWYQTVNESTGVYDDTSFKGEYFLIHTIPDDYWSNKKFYNYRVMNGVSLSYLQKDILLDNTQFMRITEKRFRKKSLPKNPHKGHQFFPMRDMWQIAEDVVKIYNGSTQLGFHTTTGARVVAMPNIPHEELAKHPYPYFMALYKDVEERYNNHVKTLQFKGPHSLIYLQKTKIRISQTKPLQLRQKGYELANPLQKMINLNHIIRHTDDEKK
jgi:hypothetical protein